MFAQNNLSLPRWCTLVIVLIGLFVRVQSAPQHIVDTFEVRKSANTSYTYQSLNGLQNGYSYAYGDSYATGYKSEFIYSQTCIHTEGCMDGR